MNLVRDHETLPVGTGLAQTSGLSVWKPDLVNYHVKVLQAQQYLL